MKGSWRRRCGAWAKHKKGRAAGKFRGLHPFCRRWAVPGKTRCHLHGGRSTGPKTPEGQAARTWAAVPAMVEGRRRRIAQLALEGRRINTGHNGGRPRKDGQPVHRKQTRQRILEDLAAMPAPSLASQEAAARILAEIEQQEIGKEIAERRKLMNLVFRGADNALSRRRDEALIARAREAAAELQRRWRGRHE
jgi:hypothetical protein